MVLSSSRVGIGGMLTGWAMLKTPYVDTVTGSGRIYCKETHGSTTTMYNSKWSTQADTIIWDTTMLTQPGQEPKQAKQGMVAKPLRANLRCRTARQLEETQRGLFTRLLRCGAISRRLTEISRQNDWMLTKRQGKRDTEAIDTNGRRERKGRDTGTLICCVSRAGLPE